MDDLSIFIKSITEVNSSDIHIIKKDLFLNNLEVNKIINKYKLTKKEIDKLFLLGKKICTQYNSMLLKNLINDVEISNHVFEKIKKYNKKKWNQLCNIIQNYYEQLKNKNIHNKKVLKQYLDLLDNNDIVTDEYMLAGFLKFSGGFLVSNETVKKYNIHSLVNLNDDIEIEYKYKITDFYYNFIKSCMDRITEKERKNFSKDIIEFNSLEKFNSLDFCINYIKKVRTKVDASEKNIKSFREDSGNFYGYKYEFIPLVEYAKSIITNKNVFIKYTGFDSSKPDGYISYDNKDEIIEITTVGLDEKNKMQKKILNEQGIYIDDVEYFDSIYSNIINEIKEKYLKKENKGYNDKRILLIYITNEILWPFSTFNVDDMIKDVKKMILSISNFEKIYVILYDKNNKTLVEQVY